MNKSRFKCFRLFYVRNNDLVGRKDNAQRDLVRYSKKCSGARVQLYWVKCVVRNQDGLASVCRRKPILPIHELLGWLDRFDHDRFSRIMGTPEQCSEFWWEQMRANQTWFRQHPCHSSIVRNPEKWIPIKLFGDEGRVGKYKAILAVHLYNLLRSTCNNEFLKLQVFEIKSLNSAYLKTSVSNTVVSEVAVKLIVLLCRLGTED